MKNLPKKTVIIGMISALPLAPIGAYFAWRRATYVDGSSSASAVDTWLLIIAIPFVIGVLYSMYKLRQHINAMEKDGKTE